MKVNVKGKNIEEIVRVKVVKDRDGKQISFSAEFEDIAKIVKKLADQNLDISFRKLKEQIEASALKGEKEIDINQLL